MIPFLSVSAAAIVGALIGYYRGRLEGFQRGHDQTLEFQANARAALSRQEVKDGKSS